MNLLDEKRPAPPSHPSPSARTTTALRDLGLGIRFAAAGGREGWTRTLLTAIGVGLGVTLLLLASSIPHMLDARSARSAARSVSDTSGIQPPASGTTVLRLDTSSDYRGQEIDGYLMRAEGANPVLPPGVGRFPAPGEMVVSPALRELLDSPDGELLRERLPYEITGTIDDAGLRAPNDLLYYAGSDTLTRDQGARRVSDYGRAGKSEPLQPVLVVLLVMVCVVLLIPVGIFIATAVRFGGDRRDRRLAALRLVGVDIRSARRIAAGEALFGSVLGLLAGAGFFLIARQFADLVEIRGIMAFPGDLVPAPWLAALVVVAVPLTAVLVTLGAMRSVVIEPLGVVRRGRERGRRLWWRLPVPLLGLGVLGLTGRVTETEPVEPYPIALGAVLVLVGLALLLPWLVEACVNRLRGGPVPWQLATRRLQLDSGAASRAVSGVTVAVAGAIALQMLFAATSADFERATGLDTSKAQFEASSVNITGENAAAAVAKLRATSGVEAVTGSVTVDASRPGDYGSDDVRPSTTLTIGTCDTLRELARIGACADGDTFVAHPTDQESAKWVDKTARKGGSVQVGETSGTAPLLWTLPADSPTVQVRPDQLGGEHEGIMATPGAMGTVTVRGAKFQALIRVDETVPDVAEYVRNTAARLDPGMELFAWEEIEQDRQYADIRTGLMVGATLVLLVIAASMLVSQLEQLRERRRLLSALAAFGTRRATLGWSVLWQTAVPVTLGLTVAVAGGLGLGWTLTWMISKSVADWWVFWPMLGAGGTLIMLVTLVSLPPLWRLMRQDGLRTE
ncbi:ABC transporter permease [Streptomyces sp. NPDC005840]|uniref:ABC transporter permease n=1 Tax=Streptomyces sp. NPDC005840 TaxID=3157072 RepID=UPI0033D08144